MEKKLSQQEKALKAAQMYYYQNLPMKHIAAELNVSHSTISRLLSWARNHGLVEIRINDIRGRLSPLEELIRLRHKLQVVKVVPVPAAAGETVWRDRVAQVSASYLNQLMESDLILGIAWGQTVTQIASRLTPKALVNAHVVQLNGGENISNLGVQNAGELVAHFANNYEATAHLFPVPTFFDYPETKEALWRERSIQRILKMQERADVLVYSIGTLADGTTSAFYRSQYLDDDDHREMRANRVVGDIANIMIRADGSYRDIPLNARACGPDLSLFQNVSRAICVVSGLNKISGLRAALAGQYLTDLVIDEPTAAKLIESFTAESASTKT